ICIDLQILTGWLVRVHLFPLPFTASETAQNLSRLLFRILILMSVSVLAPRVAFCFSFFAISLYALKNKRKLIWNSISLFRKFRPPLPIMTGRAAWRFYARCPTLIWQPY